MKISMSMNIDNVSVKIKEQIANTLKEEIANTMTIVEKHYDEEIGKNIYLQNYLRITVLANMLGLEIARMSQTANIFTGVYADAFEAVLLEKFIPYLRTYAKIRINMAEAADKKDAKLSQEIKDFFKTSPRGRE